MLPALYLVVALMVIVNALYTDPGPVGAGAAIILAGVPLYYFFKRRS